MLSGRSLPQVPRILGDSLIVSANRYPQKAVVIVGEREYSYQELLDHAQGLASFLVDRGLQRGDRVAIYLENSWESVFSIFGVLLAGGVIVVINPQTKADKLAYILGESEASFLLTSSVLEAQFAPALSGASKLRCVVCSGSLSSSLQTSVESFDNALQQGANCQRPISGVIASDLASLIYTSGSTGSPKGVMHTHLSMRFALDSLVEYLRLSDSDRILNVLPLAFDYGLYQLLMTVHIGATLILEKSFAFPVAIFKRIEQCSVTVFPGVPTIFSMILSMYERKQFSFSSVLRVTNTAAALPANYVPTLKAIFPSALIYKMYGLTECKRVSYLEPELIDQYPHSVGRAIPGTEVFLTKANGESVAPGEQGILHVRGPHLMLGYWKHKDLTNKMLLDDVYQNQKVLCSQDWFSMDEDGLLYFVGRSDDMIKSKGEKVSPIEVENVIYGIEGVKEVGVIGVEDGVLGQSIRAFVALEEGSELNGRKIKKTCNDKLEPYMVPKEVIVLDELPKSANGKIDKKALS